MGLPGDYHDANLLNIKVKVFSLMISVVTICFPEKVNLQKLE